MTAAVTELLPVIRQLTKSGIENEADWSRIKAIEFRQTLSQRQEKHIELNSLELDTTGDFDDIVREGVYS